MTEIIRNERSEIRKDPSTARPGAPKCGGEENAGSLRSGSLDSYFGLR